MCPTTTRWCAGAFADCVPNGWPVKLRGRTPRSLPPRWRRRKWHPCRNPIFFLFAALLRAEIPLDRVVPPDAAFVCGARVSRVRQSPMFSFLIGFLDAKYFNDLAVNAGVDVRRDIDEVVLFHPRRGSPAVILLSGTFDANRLYGLARNRVETRESTHKGIRVVMPLDAADEDQQSLWVAALSGFVAIGPAEEVRAVINRSLQPKFESSDWLRRREVLRADHDAWFASKTLVFPFRRRTNSAGIPGRSGCRILKAVRAQSMRWRQAAVFTLASQ